MPKVNTYIECNKKKMGTLIGKHFINLQKRGKIKNLIWLKDLKVQINFL